MVGSTAIDVSANPGDIFDHLDFGYMIYGEAQKGPWAFALDVLYMDLGEQGRTPSATYDVGVKQAAYIFSIYRRLGPRAVEAMAGATVNHLEFGFSTSGPWPSTPATARHGSIRRWAGASSCSGHPVGRFAAGGGDHPGADPRRSPSPPRLRDLGHHLRAPARNRSTSSIPPSSWRSGSRSPRIVLGAIFWRRIWPVKRRWLIDGSRGSGPGSRSHISPRSSGSPPSPPSRSAFITSTYVIFTPFLAMVRWARASPVVGESGGRRARVWRDLALQRRRRVRARSRRAVDARLRARIRGPDRDHERCGEAERRGRAELDADRGHARSSRWIFVAGRGGFHTPLAQVPWGVLIYLGLMATALVIVIQTWALARTTPVKAALHLRHRADLRLHLRGVVLRRERSSGKEVWGGALIILGVLVTEFWRPLAARLGFRPHWAR